MKTPDDKNKLASKRITKTCKECSKQVPTACKACPCGFHFRKMAVDDASVDSPTGPSSITSADAESNVSRRTQRTRRARPHFFDSLEYGTHVRRKRGQGLEPGGNKLRGWPRTATTKTKVKPGGKSKLGVDKQKKGTMSNSSSADTIVSSATAASDIALPKDSNTNAGGSSSSCSSRDEDVHGTMSTERALHYSIVLAEINRKYSSVTFRPS